MHQKFIDRQFRSCGGLAIEGLTTMIVEAVRAGDEMRVTRLDHVLQQMEKMIDPVAARQQAEPQEPS